MLGSVWGSCHPNGDRLRQLPLTKPAKDLKAHEEVL